MSDSNSPKINPGDIANWPMLKLIYRTDPDRIAALLPPGIEPSATSNVHLTVYNVPVPDEPEYGILITVDADHKGTQGVYAIGYGIDQESAIIISREMNGQPKYPCSTTYYRMGDQVTARCSHQGYTFVEFKGSVKGAVENPPNHVEHEWWVKVSRAVGGAEKSYDFPPHVVHVASTYQTVYKEELEGTLTLADSPWDPINELLPMREQVSAHLWTPAFLGRDITLETPLDPEAFWPFVDTIGGSRWPGQMGGPKRR
ncbi:acetoacetate decarboxylase family protein [Myxococcota bacterium]|nr:acetoacetate decarboxylase family protein [Myxococcota bacterium]